MKRKPPKRSTSKKLFAAPQQYLAVESSFPVVNYYKSLAAEIPVVKGGGKVLLQQSDPANYTIILAEKSSSTYRLAVSLGELEAIAALYMAVRPKE